MPDKSNRVNRRHYKQAKVYMSNGPGFTLRGTAKQIAEKYINLVKEAAETDKESLLQHADHWAREALQG